MENHIIINAREREKRWILSQGNKVIRYEIYPPDQPSKVGNVYAGIVHSVKSSLNAAFVSFDNGKNGYLSLNEIPWAGKNETIQSVLHQGQRVMVQVRKDESNTKGALLTCNVECTGIGMVYFPYGKKAAVSKKIEHNTTRQKVMDWAANQLEEKEGLIVRTEAEGMTFEQLTIELQNLRKTVGKWKQKVMDFNSSNRIVFERSSFNDSLEKVMSLHKEGIVSVDDTSVCRSLQEKVSANPSLNWRFEPYSGEENIFHFTGYHSIEEKTFKKIVWLNDGISIVIESTEAMTVVDVNSGKLAKSGDNRETIRKINERAALEIMHQLQLRDISGIVAIDFINMAEQEDLNSVTRLIKKRAASDYKHLEVIGFAPLSLFLLTRKKTKPSLEELRTVRCPVCDGKGKVLSPESLAFQLERELFEKRREIDSAADIEATTDIISAFNGREASFIKEFEQVVGFSIRFKEITHSHPFYSIRRLS
ncbi:ribonuclease E/G [Jeotgalibacillus campisalis]|uniref:Ribonuclease E n=1 Tax=Jeotgalibacillus campisalis TaxID=220754 RepID=A0A0C2VNV7_9BACL|nr:ribonuclease E/G [Jeotgalibacillus campisalis]KIL46131.1 ribonuclease E [Jeotgalibacillus campisalis]